MMNSKLSNHGLNIITNAIKSHTEHRLMQYIGSNSWKKASNRRVQHYGYTFNTEHFHCKNTIVNPCDPIPQVFVEELSQALGEPATDFNQVVIDEYMPGQALPLHIENISLFNEKIIILSLGSDVFMQFITDSRNIHSIFVPRRSITILTGDARWYWKHGVPSHMSELDSKAWKKIQPLDTRMTITFRKLAISEKLL